MATDKLPADALTKALPVDRFRQHRNAFGLVAVDQEDDGFAREGVTDSGGAVRAHRENLGPVA